MIKAKNRQQTQAATTEAHTTTNMTERRATDTGKNARDETTNDGETLAATCRRVVETTLGHTFSAAQLRKLNRHAGDDPIKNSLLPLLLLPAAGLRKAFSELSLERRWGKPTQLARIAKLLTMTAPFLAPTAAHQANAALKTIKRETAMIQTPAWDPQNPEDLMSTNAADDLWRRMAEDPSLVEWLAPVLLAFLLAQRVGDVLLWRAANVRTIGRENPEESTVSILVVEGKTVAKTGPFALQMWASTKTAALLTEWAAQRLSANLPYLFLPAGALYQTHAEARAAVRERQATIRRLCPMKLWAPRRGAAVLLGTLSVPEAQIRTLSRHPAEATLRRYMAAGLMSNTEGFAQAEAHALIENSLAHFAGLKSLAAGLA